MARSCTSHCHYAFLRSGEEDTVKGGKSCVLLRIALDQDALSFHVQPHSVHFFFFPSKILCYSIPLLSSSSFPPKHRRGDSFRLGPDLT